MHTFDINDNLFNKSLLEDKYKEKCTNDDVMIVYKRTLSFIYMGCKGCQHFYVGLSHYKQPMWTLVGHTSDVHSRVQVSCCNGDVVDKRDSR